MRKVKCIDSGIHKITNGRIYEVRCEDGTAFNITDDEGDNVWLSDTRFDDVPDAITFTSQEEFENAVMEVVVRRLGVVIDNKAAPYGNSKAYLQIEEMI